jgi:hypothetical protein
LAHRVTTSAAGSEFGRTSIVTTGKACLIKRRRCSRAPGNWPTVRSIAARIKAQAALPVVVDHVTVASGEEREQSRPMGDIIEPLQLEAS